MVIDCAAMHTLATLPDDFELRDGEEYDLHAISVSGTLVITRVIRSTPPTSQPIAKRPISFSARWGRSMTKVDDPSDLRLTHINEKHVK
jgi:hypothetical protein